MLSHCIHLNIFLFESINNVFLFHLTAGIKHGHSNDDKYSQNRYEKTDPGQIKSIRKTITKRSIHEIHNYQTNGYNPYNKAFIP